VTFGFILPVLLLPRTPYLRSYNKNEMQAVHAQ